MRFAISIGSFQLFNFVKLNCAYARRVFGDETPIVIYDAPSDECPRIKALADEYGCAYITERVNRSHFAGCLQNSITAIAFAQSQGCDIGIKLNQRTVLLSPEIPKLLEQEFRDPQVTLVSPGQYPKESILDEASHFHSRFQQAVDVLCFRANAWDAQGVADRYKAQWTSPTADRFAHYTETFWANESKRLGNAHRKVEWLTAHTPGEKFKYLRKIQNTQSDYNLSAVAIGLPAGEFKTEEWSKLKSGSYRPAPRA